MLALSILSACVQLEVTRTTALKTALNRFTPTFIEVATFFLSSYALKFAHFFFFIKCCTKWLSAVLQLTELIESSAQLITVAELHANNFFRLSRPRPSAKFLYDFYIHAFPAQEFKNYTSL